MLKISAFHLDKQKSFIPKIIEVYHVPWIGLISAKRWRLDVLNFLIHGFDKNNITKTASLTVITLLASMLSGHIPDASEIGTIKITSKCHKNSYVLYIVVIIIYVL